MKPERNPYWGYGWLKKMSLIIFALVIALVLVALLRPVPEPQWIATIPDAHANRMRAEIVGRYYSLEECRTSLSKTGGACAHNCKIYEIGPADCDSVIFVERSR
jgi:hypothetical protein